MSHRRDAVAAVGNGASGLGQRLLHAAPVLRCAGRESGQLGLQRGLGLGQRRLRLLQLLRQSLASGARLSQQGLRVHEPADISTKQRRAHDYGYLGVLELSVGLVGALLGHLELRADLAALELRLLQPLLQRTRRLLQLCGRRLLALGLRRGVCTTMHACTRMTHTVVRQQRRTSGGTHRLRAA